MSHTLVLNYEDSLTFRD